MHIVKKENSPEISKVIKPSTATQDYCLHLNTHQKSRPVKKETLLNHIKSKFNGMGIDTERVFEDLCKQGAIELINHKINYKQNKIDELAQKAA
ncbi:MAG: hypothetical protein ACU83P_03115 [Gammaproteobacteria bacterium]